MGRMPVTLGSSVPPCPMALACMIFLTHAATSWLVGPAGLSRFIVPYFRYSIAGRWLGVCPYLGFVVSSALVRISRLISHGGVVLGIRCCCPG